jgi:hypothetical protein
MHKQHWLTYVFFLAPLHISSNNSLNMADRELPLHLTCLEPVLMSTEPTASASGSVSAGSPPAPSPPPPSPSPSPSPPPPSPPPAPSRRTTRPSRPELPVASEHLACERCVRRLASSPGVAPRCVFRVGRAKCDYCVRVGHNCKRVCLTLACNLLLACPTPADSPVGSADPSKCGQAPGGPGTASPCW